MPTWAIGRPTGAVSRLRWRCVLRMLESGQACRSHKRVPKRSVPSEGARNERVVVATKCDRRRHGPPMKQNHRRACGGLAGTDEWTHPPTQAAVVNEIVTACDA